MAAGSPTVFALTFIRLGNDPGGLILRGASNVSSPSAAVHTRNPPMWRQKSSRWSHCWLAGWRSAAAAHCNTRLALVDHSVVNVCQELFAVR